MKVKIIKATGKNNWYANLIGKIFHVEDVNSMYGYKVNAIYHPEYNVHSIDEKDCVVLKESKKKGSKMTVKLSTLLRDKKYRKMSIEQLRFVIDNMDAVGYDKLKGSGSYKKAEKLYLKWHGKSEPVYYVFNPDRDKPQKKYHGKEGLEEARKNCISMATEQGGKYYILEIKESYKQKIEVETNILY